MCEMLDFKAWQSLSQRVGGLVIGGAVNELDRASVNYVTDEMISYVDVFGSRVILARSGC